MKSLISVPVMALILVLANSPAQAGSFQGPRGGSIQGNSGRIQNSQGGINGGGRATIQTPNGGSANGRFGYTTDGQGNARYRGGGRVTTPNGNTYRYKTTGSSSYSPESGYSGDRQTTVNGKTYNSTTSNGSTTITTPNGSRTFTRPRAR
jgi:hypothetical protein